MYSDPDVVFSTYSSILIALERLEDQSIDAVMLPFLPASIYENSLFRDKLRIISGPLLGDGVRMVASLTAWSELFMQKMNAGLAKLVAEAATRNYWRNGTCHTRLLWNREINNSVVERFVK